MCRPANTGLPPLAVSFMSKCVEGTGECGMGFSASALQSSPVSTSSTPFIAFAAPVSIRTMRACGCGERTIAAWV
jgi:hypothetical protein